MTTFGPAERVYVENERYDGPRAGIADIFGVPHRFRSRFDDTQDAYLGTFMVFPVDATTLALEVEQWNIFVAWNDRYESGVADLKSHPGHGGVDARWDEIAELLLDARKNTPGDAKIAVAEVVRLDREKGYTPEGPDYAMRWRFL